MTKNQHYHNYSGPRT